jgi:hypothetical protein
MVLKYNKLHHFVTDENYGKFASQHS